MLMPSVRGSAACVCLIIVICSALCVFSSAESDTFSQLNRLLPPVSRLTQENTVSALIQRVVGERSKDFTVVIDPKIGPPNRSTFLLSSASSGRLTITGTSGVSAAWGFYYYISQYGGGHVSWAGYQVNLTSPLPKVPQSGVKVTSNDRYRYYLNTCTMSYSLVWYDWSSWERQLDWMAMNAINLPLAFVGQEEIWRRVYMKMGFTQEELDAHFAGPAFLAWERMGNMHGWGGPLPSTWYKQQVVLQHQILERMREFGMTPVLPAFAGHVPANISRIFPHAKITQGGDWGGFNKTYCCTTLLDFSDPLFQQIGSSFIKEYTREFGTDHVYNCDSFNENQPPSSDPQYIRQAGQEVYRAMTTADPDAVWLMQGWLFYNDGFWNESVSKALLTSVPRGRLLVLDMPSAISPEYSRLDSYFGQPFIWTMLHNYGGNVALYGALEAVNEGALLARGMSNSSMVGTGLTMEGINQNNVMYEFMMENTWRKEPRNITAWISDYHTRRYGKYDADVDAAWQYLKRSVYNCTDLITRHGHGKNVIVHRPRTKATIDVWYQPEDVFKAWDRLIMAASKFKHSQLFRYDFVDVTRQSLQLIFIKYYNDVMAAYKAKNEQDLALAGDRLLVLLSDLEWVLASDEHFLLGRWLEAAKAKGMTPQEKRLYEYNARNQITLWGTTGSILDYANKQWSGMVSDYYRPRWKLFVITLRKSLKTGLAFNRTKFDMDVFTRVEQPFTYSIGIYPTTATGDSIDIATLIHRKYRPSTIKYASYYYNFPNWSVKRRKFLRLSYRWRRKHNGLITSHEEAGLEEKRQELN